MSVGHKPARQLQSLTAAAAAAEPVGTETHAGVMTTFIGIVHRHNAADCCRVAAWNHWMNVMSVRASVSEGHKASYGVFAQITWRCDPWVSVQCLKMIRPPVIKMRKHKYFRNLSKSCFRLECKQPKSPFGADCESSLWASLRIKNWSDHSTTELTSTVNNYYNFFITTY